MDTNFTLFVRSYVTRDEYSKIAEWQSNQGKQSLYWRTNKIDNNYCTDLDISLCRQYLAQLPEGALGAGMPPYLQKLAKIIEVYDRMPRPSMPITVTAADDNFSIAVKIANMYRFQSYNGRLWRYECYPLISGTVYSAYREVTEKEIGDCFWSAPGHETNALRNRPDMENTLYNTLTKICEHPSYNWSTNPDFIILNDGMAVGLRGPDMQLSNTSFWTGHLNFSYTEYLNMLTPAFDEVCRLEGQGNPYWRMRLLDIYGAILTAESQKLIFLLQGLPSSFKSPLVKLTKEFLVNPNAYGSINLNKMKKDRFEDSGFYGKKVIVGNELLDEPLSPVAVKFLKETVGGDIVATRRIRHDKELGEINAPIILTTNYPFRDVSDSSLACRICCLPFYQSIDKSLGQPLRNQLLLEAPGILRETVINLRNRMANGRFIDDAEMQAQFPVNLVFQNTEKNAAEQLFKDVVRAAVCYPGDGFPTEQAHIDCRNVLQSQGLPFPWGEDTTSNFGKALKDCIEEFYPVEPDFDRMYADGMRVRGILNFGWDSTQLTIFNK